MKPRLFPAAFFALVALAAATTPNAAPGATPKLAPAEAARLVAAGRAILVDVREPKEWIESGVAAPAVLLPMSDFNGEQRLWKPFLKKNAGRELILYCRTGHRAGLVAAKLAAEGVAVANAGGFKDWVAAGLAVSKP